MTDQPVEPLSADDCAHRDVEARDEMSGWHCARCGAPFVSLDLARRMVEDYAARVAATSDGLRADNAPVIDDHMPDATPEERRVWERAIRAALATTGQRDGEDWTEEYRRGPIRRGHAQPEVRAADPGGLDVALIRRVADGWFGKGASGDDWDAMMKMLRDFAALTPEATAPGDARE